MPAHKTLREYQRIVGEPIVGVSHEKFDTSSATTYLKVKCGCGEIFATKKQDLMARFLRKNNITCDSCVAKQNIAKRWDKAETTPQPTEE